MSNPEPPSNGRGEALNAFLKKKTGPLPNAVWIGISAALLFFVIQHNRQKAGTAKGAAGSDGSGGTFSSTQTTTDPTTGDQTTYTASGPTSGYLGGGPTYANASPMGYSGGDIFVNYPGQTTAPNSGPVYPPVNAPGPGSGQTGGWWYTLPSDTGAGDIANTVYQLGVDTSKALSSATTSILAGDLVSIMSANPQIDWTKVTTSGGKLPAGTALYVPLAGGTAGVKPNLPANASLTAPASYSPPSQQTSMTAVT